MKERQSYRAQLKGGGEEADRRNCKAIFKSLQDWTLPAQIEQQKKTNKQSGKWIVAKLSVVP